MKQTNHIRLSLTTPGSLQKVIKQLENYRDNELHTKTEMFISALLERGIKAASLSSGKYRNYISFEKKIYSYGNFDTVGLLIAKDTQKIISKWMRGGEVVSAEVSPLLMAEFGSGWLAEVNFPAVVGKVGQGTFPGGTHAFDVEGWYWTDLDGNKHHSYGERPTHPMYAASMALIIEIERTAREVFSR